MTGNPIWRWSMCKASRSWPIAAITPLDARGRIGLLRQVMDAVQYAHANLVIHRDLKPSNVLVTPEGQAMLLDFGIAKLLADEQGQALETELTQLGGRAMTLHYAAPEQLAGAPISIATDVYALGVLLYELIYEQLPFRHELRGALEQAILAGEPARTGAERSLGMTRSQAVDLNTIVRKALKKTPAQRYDSAAALPKIWIAGSMAGRCARRPTALGTELHVRGVATSSQCAADR